jgi:hypothetical protein
MNPVFVYPNPNLQCLVQAVIRPDRIVMRTFAIHAVRSGPLPHGSWMMSDPDAAAALAAPVSPARVTRATPAAAYLQPHAVAGEHTALMLPADAVLREVAQTALVADAALLGSGACSERAEWVVFADSGGALHAPENRILKSFAARASKAAIYGQMRRNSVLTVLMPFADADFMRAVINVKANPAIGIVCDAPTAYAVEAEGLRVGGLAPRPDDRPPFRWPDIRLTAPAQLQSDAFADITVQLVDGYTGAMLTETGPQVYLESHAGYLPQRRIRLVDGRAAARIGALGLRHGDRIRLKAGWRYYPGIVEADIAIV